jgi:hypothetical protein
MLVLQIFCRPRVMRYEGVQGTTERSSTYIKVTRFAVRASVWMDG